MALRLKDLVGLDAMLRAEESTEAATIPTILPPPNAAVRIMAKSGRTLVLERPIGGGSIIHPEYPIVDLGDFPLIPHIPDEVIEEAMAAAPVEVVSTGVVSAPRLGWFYSSQLPEWTVDAPLYSRLDALHVSLVADKAGVLRLIPDTEED